MRRFPDEELNLKIIFLDIDGVLNHELHCQEKSQEERFKEVGYPLSELNPKSITHLNNLIEQTGADVVISSTWRKNHTSDELQDLLCKVGFKGKIVGRTPILSYKDYGGHPEPHLTVPRGCEIKAWIDIHYEWTLRNKLRYLILDDDSDMLYWQKNVFIEVDSYCGLTPTDVYQGIRILNACNNELEMI